VKSKNLRELVRFSSKEPVHATVFETERLWSQLICLERNQQVGPMEDPVSEVLCTIVAGVVVVQLDRARKRVSQWAVVLVPAETQLFVTNASDEPAVVMLTAAPPPQVTDGAQAGDEATAAEASD
jgi:quercetin dioxygenase-like cupin family protein